MSKDFGRLHDLEGTYDSHNVRPTPQGFRGWADVVATIWETKARQLRKQASSKDHTVFESIDLCVLTCSKVIVHTFLMVTQLHRSFGELLPRAKTLNAYLLRVLAVVILKDKLEQDFKAKLSSTDKITYKQRRIP